MGMLSQQQLQEMMDRRRPNGRPILGNTDIKSESPFGTATMSRDGSLSFEQDPLFSSAIESMFGSSGALLEQGNMAATPEAIQAESDLLMQLLAPSQERARTSTMSNVFNKGQMGVGVGPNNANPVIQAIEEAIGQQNLGAAQTAIQSSRDNRGQLFSSAAQLLGMVPQVSSVPLEFSGLAADLFASARGFDFEREQATLDRKLERRGQNLEVFSNFMGGMMGGGMGG